MITSSKADESSYSSVRSTSRKSKEGWLVLDMGDIVLHLFTPDQREYYKIEELWSAGKVLLHLQ